VARFIKDNKIQGADSGIDQISERDKQKIYQFMIESIQR